MLDALPLRAQELTCAGLVHDWSICRRCALPARDLHLPCTDSERAGSTLVRTMTAGAAIGTVTLALALAASSAAPTAKPTFRWLRMLDNEHGYALSGQDPSRYRLLSTSDGGTTWRQVTTIHPAGPLSIVGARRWFSTTIRPGVYAVVRSGDGGRTWQRSAPFRDPRGEGAGQPFALDARHLFIAVDEGAAAGSQAEALFTSSDGGGHWRLISRTSNGLRAGALPFGCDKSGFGFATPARGWAGGYCAGGRSFFYRTDDGGRTWRRQALPVPASCACETSAPAFFSPTVGAVYVAGIAANGGGAAFVRVLWTYDGGSRWAGSGAPLGRVETVSYVDARDVWITGQKANALRGPFDRLARTDDAGKSWQTVRLPFDAGDYGLDALSATTAYAYSSNVILVTHDGGRTWRKIHAAANAG